MSDVDLVLLIVGDLVCRLRFLVVCRRRSCWSSGSFFFIVGGIARRVQSGAQKGPNGMAISAKKLLEAAGAPSTFGPQGML